MNGLYLLYLPVVHNARKINVSMTNIILLLIPISNMYANAYSTTYDRLMSQHNIKNINF